MEAFLKVIAVVMVVLLVITCIIASFAITTTILWAAWNCAIVAMFPSLPAITWWQTAVVSIALATMQLLPVGIIIRTSRG